MKRVKAWWQTSVCEWQRNVWIDNKRLYFHWCGMWPWTRKAGIFGISRDGSAVSWIWIPRGLISHRHHISEHVFVMYPVQRCYCDDENSRWWPCFYSSLIVPQVSANCNRLWSSTSQVLVSSGLDSRLGVCSIFFLLPWYSLWPKAPLGGEDLFQLTGHSPLLREVRDRTQGRNLKQKRRRNTNF